MITKVKWNNYRSLGNLELDFTKSNGVPYHTIILAGENGTGKTTILDSLSSYLNKQSIGAFDYIEYEIGGIRYVITPMVGKEDFGFHVRRDLRTGIDTQIISGRNNYEDHIKNDTLDLRHYGFAYSKARCIFRPSRPIFTAKLITLHGDTDHSSRRRDHPFLFL